MSEQHAAQETEAITKEELKAEILSDYRIAHISRETSLMGRKEVLTGKAKFGIFGDGKELAQIALAKQWREGDFRSGYYRDQTVMMAAGLLTTQQFFAQLYAHTDTEAEPASGGRQMNGHYATRTLNPDGTWRNLKDLKNSSADVSPTASQMPRLLGLAYASKFYRNNPELKGENPFSNGGNELAFGTIGDASTSEGMFWETMNAAGVVGVPLLMSVWDDGHGISVPIDYQTTKKSISSALQGLQREQGTNGIEIFKVKAWDYVKLCLTYEEAARIAREEHIPVLVHVQECTQPQGHSTSGSHERYKSPERLQWEQEYDCIQQFKKWILAKELASTAELEDIEKEAKNHVKEARKSAWESFQAEIRTEQTQVLELLAPFSHPQIKEISASVAAQKDPERRQIMQAARRVLRLTRHEDNKERHQLSQWLLGQLQNNQSRYDSYLYSESRQRIQNIDALAPIYSENSPQIDGREILRDNFAELLTKYPEVIIFGEDSGKIGGVNQGLEGLQARFGEHRVFDTGIRECTIVGQGLGMAMRGLKPIAEIQYLDYLLYALQVMSDDLSTVQYRTKGGQKAPLIIRTRGHRLEGIWHSGSPMGMIINACRGMHICTPRNMTQAAGMYNTLLESDEPALVIESLNGYRLKEQKPDNLGEYKVPLGISEVLREGNDLTLVTYGSMVRMALEAANELSEMGIETEVIDLQTLLPFDLQQTLQQSLQKTNRLLIVDEDVPGGASAYILQQVLEVQNGYHYLDSAPATLTAKAHRPAYGSDGDYFSKPSIDDIVERAYTLMSEADPGAYPAL
jgi:pyruvate/2-oxoglutarate/acetoin dehydrogenase E1 component/TPP-dependent pyruvate/acetoin dehydrogenase alpha subunit